jgi:hypothetical protein
MTLILAALLLHAQAQTPERFESRDLKGVATPRVEHIAFIAPFALAQNDSRPPLIPRNDCRDDSGLDRCDPENQRVMRSLYGAPAIEELAASGAEIRRAFFVDGYGKDV